MLDYFDIPLIICLAVIFHFSGNTDVPLSFILSIFLFYLIKMLIYFKYKYIKTPDHTIKDIINVVDIKEEMENFIDYEIQNEMDDLDKM